MVNRAFWNGKKVFLTGHTGFKGAWMKLWLEDMGATVYGYSLDPPSIPNAFSHAFMFDPIYGDDVNELNQLKLKMNDAQPDIIIHMAAQPLIRESYNNPINTLQTNIIGTVNVLEAIRECATVKVCLIVTTDKVYERTTSVCTEKSTLKGYDPYSTSKVCAEHIVDCYRNSFFNVPINGIVRDIVIATARAGNVIGGGDWGADRLVPDIVRAISTGTTPVIRHPDSIRPWQFILDVLCGYLSLCENMYNKGKNYEGAWNFGPHAQLWTVKDVLNTMGVSFTIEDISKDSEKKEATTLVLSNEKARLHLDWMPVSIEKALNATQEWYLLFYENASEIKDFSLSQIRDYEKGLLHD